MSPEQPSAMNWAATPAAAPRTYQDYMVPAMFQALTTRVLTRLELTPGLRVLDVACGTGVMTRALAEAGAAPTGLDLTPAMLAIAEELSPGLEFVQASADAIPFDDGDFDALTCQQGLQFFPDRRAGLAEMRRIVRPGGQVVVATWCDPSQSGFAVIARVLTRHLGESVGNIMLAPFVINQEADLRGLLEEAGLSQIVVERETIEARYADPDEYAIKVMMAGPMAGPLMEQSEATRAALAADITAELGPMRQGNELVFPMPTLIATARA